jgi:hypothetical protein
MANINKFSPVSPDTFLKAGSDMALAKFGHLNAIVDAYNTLDTAVTAFSPSAGALKGNTITESTTGTGVTINGQIQPTPILAITTTTLTAAQSGSLIKLDLAAGFVVTLPTAKAGLRYEFLIGTSVTSNNYTIQASAATELFTGAVINSSSSANFLAPANGSTHYKLILGTTTTGGQAGGRIRITCQSATNWIVEGSLFSTGGASSPFSA